MTVKCGHLHNVQHAGRILWLGLPSSVHDTGGGFALPKLSPTN